MADESKPKANIELILRNGMSLPGLTAEQALKIARREHEQTRPVIVIIDDMTMNYNAFLKHLESDDALPV